MKSIVLCEPSYGGQRKEDRSSNKSKKNGIKNAENRVKNDDGLSDIEICLVIGNTVNGGEETEMRKDESNKTEEEEERPADDDCAVGESLQASNGVDETFKDDEDIEILSCSVEKEGASEKGKNSNVESEISGKAKESAVKDTASSAHGNVEDRVDSKENGVCETDAAECSAPCTTDDKPASEEEERAGDEAVESESDCRLTDDNTGNAANGESDVQEKAIGNEEIDCEFDAEEGESNPTSKQSSDEGFIEEEENKENRSEEGRRGTDGDGKVRRKENTGKTTVLESVESEWERGDGFKSWNKEKAEIYGFQANGEEVCLVDNEMDVDFVEGGKSEECSVAEEENVPVSSSEKAADVNGKAEAEEVEFCVDVNKAKPEKKEESKEEVVQKRKRRSLDGREAVKSSMKKRRTRSYDSTESEVNRRHSHDAAFTETSKSKSCLDSEDNENEGDHPKADNDAHKKNTLEESIDRVASAHTSLPFIESLRGTIKALSRGDLEELIVQKLCEVITERSTVGMLRKKAQALELDQERWKEKVQSLTKQLREMDMVMKKYMNEVQKQSKERNFQMVTPLRVTRSVGLQVSFGSSSSKQSKVVTNNNQAKQPIVQAPEKVVKPPSQLNVSVSPNAKKNVPTLPSTQVKRPVKEQKKPFSPRSGVNVTFQTRLISPQSVVTPNAAIQAQHMNALNRPRLPGVDQSNSKIIDLTDDDDRQNSHTAPKTVLQPGLTVRPPGQIRVVNHIQPAQVSTAGRVAYLVPATTATAGASTVPPQGRQLLIATPTVQPPARQLPSVPPLLYKGSTILQPGAQQTGLINQPNRALMPKPLKHPAPLPQPPANQITKPNLKLLPPRPALKISKVQTGIVLSWNMVLGPEYEPIASYQLYAYQENNSPPTTSLWKKVGDVKALPLPMACTLTQFMSGHKYYFAVRAVDLHSRIGPFSFPGSIVLIK